MNRLLGEENVFFFVSLITLFLLVNFDRTFGLIYGFMFITAHLIHKANMKDIPIENEKGNTLTSILFGLAGYVAFIFASYGLALLIRPLAVKLAGGGALSIVSAMAADVPVLAASTAVIIFAWTFFIPIYETALITVMLERISQMFNIPLSRNGMFNIRTMGLFVAVSVFISYLHLTAKIGLGDLAFISTFVFFFIACAMIVYFGEQKQAILTHMFANGRAVLTKYGYLSLSAFGGF